MLLQTFSAGHCKALIQYNTMVERGHSKPGCVSSSLGRVTLFSSFLIPFCVMIFSKFFLIAMTG